MQNVWLALVTGFTTGGISCLAVQGGLLASSLTHTDTQQLSRNDKVLRVSVFLVFKILAYTLLGFGLGILGSSLVLSPKLLGFMQIIAGIFMLGTAGRLLNLHPVFRYFVIQPPKWALKLLKNQSKHEGLIAPATLGGLTILIPCGVTQAMMLLAISTASPLFGALIMFAFTLGTSPLFFAIGYAITEILKRKVFVFLSSATIIVLGLVSINTGQVLRDSPHTFQNYLRALTETSSNSSVYAKFDQGEQKVNITVSSYGYTASADTLKIGVPVKLTLETNGTLGCARAFTIPSLNISKILPETGQETLMFTPQKIGRLSYTCSMGMYTGAFTVVN